MISVSIIGSQGIILRASTDEVVYEDPDVITTETEEPTEVNETESSKPELLKQKLLVQETLRL